MKSQPKVTQLKRSFWQQQWRENQRYYAFLQTKNLSSLHWISQKMNLWQLAV